MLKFLVLVFTLPLDLYAIKIINYKQNDVVGKTERIEVSTANPQYVKVLQSETFKFNRTCVAYNLTMHFLKDYENELVSNVQAYKFTSNEYRYFPIKFPMNVCRLMEQDLFGSHELLKCGNFTSCPYKKGIYTICNLVVDFSTFPPHIPFGRYMMETKLAYRDTTIMTFNWYIILKDAKWEHSD